MEKKYIEKLALLQIKNKKLLVVFSRDRENWFLLGGKPDEGETHMEALRREVMEEAGCSVNEESLKYYGEFEAPAFGKPEGTFVKSYCYLGELNSTPTPSAEVTRIEYVGVNGFNNSTELGKIILQKLIADGLVE